mmetsp:Transcript_3577/g.5541  ORF Transcript_3577/g.5541 Transcript_3577/m.5541 type:complete len:130 (+) Transcript_3577:142-531(+)
MLAPHIKELDFLGGNTILVPVATYPSKWCCQHNSGTEAGFPEFRRVYISCYRSFVGPSTNVPSNIPTVVNLASVMSSSLHRDNSPSGKTSFIETCFFRQLSSGQTVFFEIRLFRQILSTNRTFILCGTN